MVLSRFDRKLRDILFVVGSLFALASVTAQAPLHYEPTIESLSRHPLPQWYADAKLGIFVHWGLYSVPGWAPTAHSEHDFESLDYITHNPYAEWYLNSMRIDDSPTQVYHKEHYGADYDHYNFAPIFNRQIQKWNPETWAKVFHDAGAKYVVLTTKHHDGFTLWPSTTPNPTLPADRQHATRDLVGDLTSAVRKEGLRMGLYYSGGYDWTFVPGPIRVASDHQTVKPQSPAYGKYADAQMTRLKALGAWLKINGDAIYGTQPWKRADGVAGDGIRVRFTQKDSSVYAILLAKPKANTVTIKSLSPQPGTKISLLGNTGPL